MLVQLSGLTSGYGGRKVLSGVTCSIAEGERWAVIGRNGVGKSTLVKCIAGLIPTGQGMVSVNGRDVAAYPPRDLARLVAYVPQPTGRTLPPYTVFDYVMMGRFPYQGFMAIPSDKDRAIVLESLALTDTTDLAERQMNTLSGGEVQRVFLAGAVSQQTRILLLDEPATFLDPLHQEMVRRALDRIHDEYGTTMVTVTHDVNTATGSHTHVLALVDGATFFSGTVAEFQDRCPRILEQIYSIPFENALCVHSRRRVMVPMTATSGTGDKDGDPR